MKYILLTYSTNKHSGTFPNRKCEEPFLTPKIPKMCDPIVVTLLKMRPHYSQSSRENVTPSPLASYKEVSPRVFYLSTPPCLHISQAHLDWPLALHAGYKTHQE